MYTWVQPIKENIPHFGDHSAGMEEARAQAATEWGEALGVIHDVFRSAVTSLADKNILTAARKHDFFKSGKDQLNGFIIPPPPPHTHTQGGGWRLTRENKELISNTLEDSSQSWKWNQKPISQYLFSLDLYILFIICLICASLKICIYYFVCAYIDL